MPAHDGSAVDHAADWIHIVVYHGYLSGIVTFFFRRYQLGVILNYTLLVLYWDERFIRDKICLSCI